MILNVQEIPDTIGYSFGPHKKGQEGPVVGVTSGCYDLFHFYHLHYLERCKAECDFLIVGVDSDALLTYYKQKKPVIPEYHRAAVVAGLKCVDAVFIMRNLKDLEKAINYSWAQKLFKNKKELYGQPIITTDVNPELVIIPDVEELTSTSAIVAEIQKRAQ